MNTEFRVIRPANQRDEE